MQNYFLFSLQRKLRFPAARIESLIRWSFLNFYRAGRGEIMLFTSNKTTVPLFFETKVAAILGQKIRCGLIGLARKDRRPFIGWMDSHVSAKE